MAAATNHRDPRITAPAGGGGWVAPVSELTWWPAPAKLNLFLHVTGRRQDGYHDLQTIFQLIDRCDRIGLTLRPDGAITRSAGMPDVEPDKDLAVRAARALQRHTGTALGADIQVIKHIPAGGGLGGGSSDAASVLLALNALWRCDLSLAQLAELGLALGRTYRCSSSGSQPGARAAGNG